MKTLYRCVFVLVVLSAVCFVDRTHAQFTQQGSKLVGTGAVGNAYQGQSVSLSSDGNTAIVGGFFDDDSTGAVWVFIRSGGMWSQQGNKLVGTGAVGSAWQGTSVSISSDGNTAVVGGPYDNFGSGAAWIFTRTAGVWSQQGSKLVGTGALGNAEQGTSVSISSDGNTAIVGGWYDNNRKGAVWVFTRTGGVWSQQGSKLVGTGATAVSGQGSSVALSSDGNTAIVGAFLDNIGSGGAGAVWIFTRTAGVWSQQGSKLVGTGATAGCQQGRAVSLSSDGNRAVVGGPYQNTDIGGAWVFTRSGGVWSQQGTYLVGTGAVGPAYQGFGVSISADGNTALVGGYWDNTAVGATWVFTRSGGVWSQLGNKLVGTGVAGHPYQGKSVSISSDGSTIIMGGYGDNSYTGAAWVFARGPSGVHGARKEVPEHFSIEQNYPNPFNPTTTIEYSLPQRASVEIKVLDFLGREVATLLNEEKPAGVYTVRWNADGLASGVYFYRLQAGSFVATKKLLLLR